jgi:hypothetical protein
VRRRHRVPVPGRDQAPDFRSISRPDTAT